MGRGPTKEYHKDMMEGYIVGTLTCFKPEYVKKNINMDFPLVLNIEPTNDCNLKCYLCPRNNSFRKVGYMDFQLFKKIVDECKRHRKLNMVNFHKDGEPLLHPRIYEMIRYAHDSDIANVLHMNTNGLLLNERHYKDFLDSGIDDVTVSIDAARPETFKNIKKVDALKTIESNIAGFLKYRKINAAKKPFIRVKIMEFDDVGKSEIEEFIKKWQGVADEVQVTGVHNWSGSIQRLRVTNESKPKRYPCSVLWYALAVNWDGSVSPCSVDWDLTAAVGDASKHTLHDIWNSDSIKKLRRAELSQIERFADVCIKCSEWANGTDLTDWLPQQKEFYK